jgi:hypothetical protein
MHRTKEERLHHKERIKTKVVKYLKLRTFYTPEDIERCSYFYDTRQRCSCDMCGNERKYFKKRTVQERKAEQEKIDFNLNEISVECLQ